MNGKIRRLTLPLDRQSAERLRLGEVVSLTGLLFTGRSRFHIRAIEEGILPPIDYTRINTFFHVGPVMRPVGEGWEVVSVEPTSSIRFERYSPAVIRKLNLRTVIGKTTLGPASTQALREVGGVFLSKIGLCGNRLADHVTRIRAVWFLDELGKTEATWVMEVHDFGPFFVAIDAHGHHYFNQLDAELREKRPAVYQALGIPPDYRFADVSAQSVSGGDDPS